MKPVYSTLRTRGHVSSGYLDDSFLLGDTSVQCQSNVNSTYSLFGDLGFNVSREKSVTQPTQVIEHLGFVLNPINMTVSLIWQADGSKIEKRIFIQFNAYIHSIQWIFSVNSINIQFNACSIQCIFNSMDIQLNAYSIQWIFNSMLIQFNGYSIQCLFNSMRIQYSMVHSIFNALLGTRRTGLGTTRIGCEQGSCSR